MPLTVTPETVAGYAAVVLARDALRADYLRPGERILSAAMHLDYALGESLDPPVYTESALADLTGMTRHQVRQAVIPLVQSDVIERGWDTTSPGRPSPVYRLSPKP